VQLFEGADSVREGRIDLGGDADNVRVDARAPAVVIGHGDGGLAIIDPRSRKKVGEIPLPAHPEGFQLAGNGQIYVNLPSAQQIALVDRGAGKLAQTIATGRNHANFPMALDPDGGFLVVFRDPPRLAAYAVDGTVRSVTPTCGDADDVFVDARRNRVYVSCGEGFVDVFERRARIAHIATHAGSRTSFFAPELDRLYLAVRAQGGEPAAIWVFQPTP
jgi:DNA-binding beta-propeller fold protein YncE